MPDLSPGQEVTVSPSGITAEVLYVRGDSVRVRNVNSGKARTVAIKNVTPKSSSPVPKPVTLTSPAYLAFVREHPCCVCGAPGPSEPHHWSHHGAARGKKCDDYRTVPLCDHCHMGEWHRVGTFPGMLRVQRELLLAWTATRIWDGDMVDALIRAIGGADA